ncbi:MAG TPA: GAF domain-containing protein, partial [Anaerolineales bacterium]|nr:GAF domain-containing protein [Anaerolineales bacterium]
PGSMNSPTPIYIFLGGTASLLGSVILVVLLLDRFTLPLRSILLPIEFEAQLKGRAGASINGRFLSLILTLMAIGVLLIAPIGYRQTVDVRYGGIDSLDVFREVQSQTILFGLLTLLFGAVYSYYLTKSVSDPLKELISSFDKIENSDLSVRLPVSGTDELGVVTMQFNRMVSRLEELRNSLEQQESKRTRRLAAMYEVGRAASSSLDPNELLARVIMVLTEQFNYYHAAIYLLDPSEKWAELKEASGEASSILKQNHHRLEVSGRSLVGSAIREKSARIVAIASGEKQRFDNPLLPRTRSEIALPLIAGNRVQGALNIQSSKESDFRPEIIETMQNMANQVAIALDNARLFQDAQQNIREMRAIQQQYQLTGWSSFSESDEALEYGVGDESGDPAKKIDVSISLRDQVLGQIQLESNLEWTPEKESLVNAVATQAAIALENARLVSESRQIAVRERMLADINSKIWASATIEGVLQTVAKELGRHLDASRATVELNMDENS